MMRTHAEFKHQINLDQIRASKKQMTDQRRSNKKSGRLAGRRAAPSSFHHGAAILTIHKPPNMDPAPSPSPPSPPPRLKLNDHDHAATVADAAATAASMNTTSNTVGVARLSAAQINAVLAAFAHNPETGSVDWWTFVGAAQAAAAICSDNNNEDDDGTNNNNNNGDEDREKTMTMLLGLGFMVNLTAVVPILGVDPRGYVATVALLRALDGLASVRGGEYMMMTIAPNAIVMRWIISLLQAENIAASGGPGHDGTTMTSTMTTGTTIRTGAVQILVTLLEQATEQPEQQTRLAKTLLLDQAFLVGLMSIMNDPADENRVYSTELVAVAVRCIKLVVAAVGAAVSSSDQNDGVDDEVEHEEKLSTEITTLATLWTKIPNSHVNHKRIIAALVEVLDAASQHGPVTTSMLASVINYDVLVNILQCDDYHDHDHHDSYHSLIILNAVVRCIVNITPLDGPEYVDKIIAAGFVPCCARLLAGPATISQGSGCTTRRIWNHQKQQLRTLHSKTLLAMANIAAGTVEQVHALFHDDPEIPSTVIALANSTRPSCRSQSAEDRMSALWLLVNAMTGGAVGDLTGLVRAGALKPIVKLLVRYRQSSSFPDKTLTMIALDALNRTMLEHLAVADLECLRNDRDLFDAMDIIEQLYEGEPVAQSAEAVKQLLSVLQEPEVFHDAPPPPAAAADQAARRLF
jgi:hypothetical protein